jgi:Myotubularin-like phosphatase domain
LYSSKVYITVDDPEQFGMVSNRLIAFPLSRVVSYTEEGFGTFLKASIQLRYSISIKISDIECTIPVQLGLSEKQFFEVLKGLHFTVPGYNMNSLNYFNCLRELLSGKIDTSKNHQFLKLIEEDHAKHDEFLMNMNKKMKTKFKRTTNFNESGVASICRTYPKEFLMPVYLLNETDQLQLKEIINFREKQRIPVLCYVYQNSDDKHCSIWRSGQIKSGLFNNVSKADQNLLRFVAEISFNDENFEKRAHIFDCRPYINAYGNKITGKGFIDNKNYHVHDVVFGDIQNIHYMRNKFEALLNNIEMYDKNKTALADWYDTLKSILKGAMLVRDLVLKGDSVIVNCSDGWDRTPQIVSLSKILLEPYYRTIEGFRILLHYEWIGFGHKYKSRQQHDKSNKEESPVFIQFLDCVHQLIERCPHQFEFSSKLLVIMAKAFIENMFMEFACDNTEQYLEYRRLSADDKDHGELSIWQFIEQNIEKFKNEGYRKEGKVIEFQADDPFSYKLWLDVYYTHKPHCHDKVAESDLDDSFVVV